MAKSEEMINQVVVAMRECRPVKEEGKAYWEALKQWNHTVESLGDVFKRHDLKFNRDAFNRRCLLKKD